MGPLQHIGRWLESVLGDEERLYLLLLFGFGLLFLVYFGAMLAPFFAALVFTFVLQGLVSALRGIGLSRILAVHISFLIFISAMLILLFLMVPLLGRQINVLVSNLPQELTRLQDSLLQLPSIYPSLVTENQVTAWVGFANEQLGKVGTWLVQASLAAIPDLLGLVIYLVLVPILVFFMLRDQELLIAFAHSLLPRRRALLTNIGREVNSQFARYVRGKVMEIIIVSTCSYLTFSFFGLDYAMLLAVIVGLSVLFPFVGAALTTFPIVIIALSQWGWSAQTFWVVGAYGVIQALDGNLLVPLLFSSAINMHPVTIILAVLFFGGIWGFWGLFFAIPLAILVKSIYGAWPDLEGQLQAADATLARKVHV